MIGLVLGVVAAALLMLLLGVYSIGPTVRGVITTFERAQRLEESTAGGPEWGGSLTAKERQRYDYPLIRVIPPGVALFQVALATRVQAGYEHRGGRHHVGSRGEAGRPRGGEVGQPGGAELRTDSSEAV